MRPWADVKGVVREALDGVPVDKPPELFIGVLMLLDASDLRKAGPENGGVNPLVVELGVTFRLWPGLC